MNSLLKFNIGIIKNDDIADKNDVILATKRAINSVIRILIVIAEANPYLA